MQQSHFTRWLPDIPVNDATVVELVGAERNADLDCRAGFFFMSTRANLLRPHVGSTKEPRTLVMKEQGQTGSL